MIENAKWPAGLIDLSDDDAANTYSSTGAPLILEEPTQIFQEIRKS